MTVAILIMQFTNNVILAITAEFKTPAFDYGVGKTLQMYNRVNNFFDMGIEEHSTRFLQHALIVLSRVFLYLLDVDNTKGLVKVLSIFPTKWHKFLEIAKIKKSNSVSESRYQKYEEKKSK